MLAGIFLQQGINGDDKGRDKLSLIGNDGYLIDVLVDEQLRLNHLRCDILAIGSLEEVLDALFKEQLTTLEVARVASTEEAIFSKGGLGEVIAIVVALRDGGAFQQHFALFADTDLDTLDGDTYATNGIRLAQMVTAYCSKALRKAIAHDHIDADGVDELLNLGIDRSTSRGEEVGILKAQFLADE